MPERRLAEPPVIDLDAWFELPPPVFNYARRIAKYFMGQPVAIGVEVVAGGSYRVWRCERRNGQRYYELQLDTTPDRAEAHGP